MLALPAWCLFAVKVQGGASELVKNLYLYWRVQTLPKVGAPLHFRRFDSGVLVVQSDSHSDEQARPHMLRYALLSLTAAAACCTTRSGRRRERSRTLRRSIAHSLWGLTPRHRRCIAALWAPLLQTPSFGCGKSVAVADDLHLHRCACA